MLTDWSSSQSPRMLVVPRPIIVGAGPSGLAVAASLNQHSVPSTIIEQSDGISHIWNHCTYDRLCLHIPKPFCQLPHLPFPTHFPRYPSRSHFTSYLFSYARRFSLHPLFHHTVVSARFDFTASVWRVTAIRTRNDSPVGSGLSQSESSESLNESCNSTSESGDSRGKSVEPEVVEYVSPWLVVATGENAEPVVPELKGKETFEGRLLHTSEYKSGREYKGKKVLVMGCGNSGMEVSLDLYENGAMPFMAVRSGVHVLPREMLGTSTFGLAMKLLKCLPVRFVDRILLMAAKMVIGDTEKYGLRRPKMGPIELKSATGKAPVLDVGTFSLIKNGRIKIVPEVESLIRNGAKFVDGREMGFDSVIFATGYRSNVPFWLKDTDFFTKDGKPRTPFPNGWKGENGLYCVGFTGRGLLGAGADAINIAHDIAGRWKDPSEHKSFVPSTTPQPKN